MREKDGAMRKAEEDLFLAKRELEKAQAKAKISAPGANSLREDELQQELTKAMVRVHIDLTWMVTGLNIIIGSSQVFNLQTTDAFSYPHEVLSQ